jgi:hypothetical protein
VTAVVRAVCRRKTASRTYRWPQGLGGARRAPLGRRERRDDVDHPGLGRADSGRGNQDYLTRLEEVWQPTLIRCGIGSGTVDRKERRARTKNGNESGLSCRKSPVIRENFFVS